MGMCLPLVLRTFPGLLGKRSSLVAAVLVLLGGFVLRYSILTAAPAVLERAEATGSASIRTIGDEPTSLSQAASVLDQRADVVEELLTLVRDRLELMDDVALAKWRAAKPIEDLERERELLQALQHEATVRNISPVAVSVFFQAQMRAGKQIQQAYFDEWTRELPSHNQAPDLAGVLRPKLDSLNARLLDSLVRSADTLNDPSRREVIRRLGEHTLNDVRLSDHERTELLDRLLQSAEILSERTDRSD
jgi:chorismate mutase